MRKRSKQNLSIGLIAVALSVVIVVAYLYYLEFPETQFPGAVSQPSDQQQQQEEQEGQQEEPPTQQNLTTDLSGVGAGFYSQPEVEAWLESRTSKIAMMEGWFMFPEDLADDVLWCVDVEFFEPPIGYLYAPSSDWVSLVYINRKGQVIPWFGDPHNDYQAPASQYNPATVEIIELGQGLEPNVWHRIRVVTDLVAKKFVSFNFYEPSSGMNATLDLSSYYLWRNPAGSMWDGKVLGYYLGAFKAPLFHPGSNVIYADDIVGKIYYNEEWITVLNDGFEAQPDIFPLKPMMEKDWWRRETWEEGKWYQERLASVVGITSTVYRSDGHSCFLDASPFEEGTR